MIVKKVPSEEHTYALYFSQDAHVYMQHIPTDKYYDEAKPLFRWLDNYGPDFYKFVEYGKLWIAPKIETLFILKWC